mgnify:FL=1
MTNNIELLAPAGSYEALVAAVQNGANAIYLGGNEFSARAFATNFDHDELKKALRYCHLRNVKVYVTVNTLYEDNQFAKLKDYLLFLSSINVDALIIQDIGLMAYVKKYFPNFEIHMSTQASIYSLEAVKYFEKIGVERVVLARENSLQEIKNICNHTNLDIEVFVHGALCMSYSGQCLMSSMVAKRSGNKGTCGQPCRLAYKLQKDGKSIDQIPSYLLSPKDLCTLENVDKLIEAGITSFKIEGRMKRPEYVAIIVSQYRKAIDAYFNNQKIVDYKERLSKMKQMFNRGFTGGFLLQDKNFMASDYPGNRGINLGKVIDYDYQKKLVKIKLETKLKQGDRIDFQGIDYTRTITKLFLNNKLVNFANANEIIEIELNTPVKKGTPVYKIIDLDLIEKAQASYQKENIKNEIEMYFTGQINTCPNLTIIYQDKVVDTTSNLIIEPASKAPLSSKRIKEQLGKLGNTVFKAENIIVDFPDNGFFSLKEINQMRRSAIEKLELLLTDTNDININIDIERKEHLNKKIKGICIRVYTLSQLEAIIDQDIAKIYFPLTNELKDAIFLAAKHHKKIVPFTGFLSNIKQLYEFKNSDLYQAVDEILVGNYGALEIFKDKKCSLDTTFNLYNSYALSYLKYDAILSLEMSKKQVNNLIDVKQNITMVVYGKTVNMHLKHCIISNHYFNEKRIGCNMCKKGKYSLFDRKGESFTILTDDNCNNLIFNSHHLYINKLNDLEVDYVLLSFSDEDSNTVKLIYDEYKKIVSGNNCQIPTFIKHTNGYFYD